MAISDLHLVFLVLKFTTLFSKKTEVCKIWNSEAIKRNISCEVDYDSDLCQISKQFFIFDSTAGKQVGGIDDLTV